MAGASLLTLLDDIAHVLDDVALMTKAAGKKTAGVLGDDIALNAQQVSGMAAARELPVVMAVAVGSFKNKLILVPAALAISAFLPWGITPLLMVGGLYLCFEGVEKIVHSLFHRSDAASIQPAGHGAADSQAAAPVPTPEASKIKGAIRTDFILSAEIIAISLGTVAHAEFMTQALVVTAVAIIMTVGVYGFVAAVVKLDDAGLYLSLRKGAGVAHRLLRGLGNGILAAAPYLMKGLSIVGTAAMFLVGGGILVHGIPAAGQFIHQLIASVEQAGAGVIHAVIELIGPLLANALVGMVAGLVALGAVSLVRQAKRALA